MALFSIYDGRSAFWQWDVNQKLIVSDSTYDEIHFCNDTTEGALVCKPYIQDGVCVVNVPNILLQSATPLRVFVYIKDKKGYRTTHTEVFAVIARPKPSDYIYTETEVLTVEQAVQDALQDAKDSGAFKGEPGPKGDPGVVKFVVVQELPETDVENAIYLLPDLESAEGNLFTEWIYVDGKWEKIGGAAVQVDLTNYVKNTDFSTVAKAGLVRCESFNGVTVASSNGTLLLFKAQKTDIDAKAQQYRPIVPANLDYAVKKGLAANTEEWTEEEQAAAQKCLGIEQSTCIVGSDVPHSENGTIFPDKRCRVGSLYLRTVPVELYVCTMIGEPDTWVPVYTSAEVPEGQLTKFYLDSGAFGQKEYEVISGMT